MLLDSNLIIYASEPEHAFLRGLLKSDESVVSGISYPEVLGYTKLKSETKAEYEEFFEAIEMLPVDGAVLKRAAELRQMRKLKLGDAIIAGTALVHGLTLATHDKEDFQWIPGLSLIDPFDQKPKNQSEEGA